jgi:hypothetical protein
MPEGVTAEYFSKLVVCNEGLLSNVFERLFYDEPGGGSKMDETQMQIISDLENIDENILLNMSDEGSVMSKGVPIEDLINLNLTKDS